MDIINICMRLLIAYVSIIYGTILYRKCETGNGFKFLYSTSLDRCLEECLRRVRCAGVMYAREMAYCELVDNFHPEDVNVEQPICMYVNIEHLSPAEVIEGACAFRPCDDIERCVSHETRPRRFYCETLECPRPQELPNARPMANKFDIGSTNMYKCNNGYSLTGNASFQCLPNGTWSIPDFECKKMCVLPPKSFTNANLTLIESHNRFAINTIVQFKCRESYLGSGDTFTAVCGVNGEWWPPTVQCVKSGSELIDSRYSRRIYGQQLRLYRLEMRRYCRNAGGYMINPWSGLITSLSTSEQFTYLSLVTMKSQLSTYPHYNLTYCLQAELGDASPYLLYSYDQLVATVRRFGLQSADTSQCRTAGFWATREPNGMDAENCIVADRNENYRWKDVACKTSSLYQHTGFVCQFILPLLPEWSQ